MCFRYSRVIVLLAGAYAFGDVFSYEADSFPDEAGWGIVQLVCEPEQWVDDDWFHQHVKLCDGFPPPGGQEGTYRRSLAAFIGVERFFVEWRMETDGDRSELPWGGPSDFSVWSNGPVNYRFSIARDQAELNRDNLLPIVLVDIEPGVPHTHRLELYGDELYVWYIDGQIVDSGVPEAAFPSFNPNVNMRAKAAFLQNTTRWDYVRWGSLPGEGSGDFDSDGSHDIRDFYFLHECILGVDRPVMRGGGVDPGCLWGDLNQDNVADLLDFAEFQIAFTGDK